ncbi:hypothetical protein HHI36_007892, partial [Cryptolaemus montrouzieri]
MKSQDDDLDYVGSNSPKERCVRSSSLQNRPPIASSMQDPPVMRHVSNDVRIFTAPEGSAQEGFSERHVQNR